jgi:hypothetical protein
MLSAADDARCPSQDVLMDKLPAASPPARAFSISEIEGMQSLMVSANEDFSINDDESIISGEGEDLLVPPSQQER